jgi:hypothetical protein
MGDDSDFQIVCTSCGCLSVKIEEPLKSSRDAIVYCGDCGTSRGTVGALRDLAVQRGANDGFPAPSSTRFASPHTTYQPRPATRISAQYAELRRLRQQVKTAESLANESHPARTTNRVLANHRT